MDSEGNAAAPYCRGPGCQRSNRGIDLGHRRFRLWKTTMVLESMTPPLNGQQPEHVDASSADVEPTCPSWHGTRYRQEASAILLEELSTREILGLTHRGHRYTGRGCFITDAYEDTPASASCIKRRWFHPLTPRYGSVAVLTGLLVRMHHRAANTPLATEHLLLKIIARSWRSPALGPTSLIMGPSASTSTIRVAKNSKTSSRTSPAVVDAPCQETCAS